MGELQRAQRPVKAPGEGPCGALGMQAQAVIANVKGGLDRNGGRL